MVSVFGARSERRSSIYDMQEKNCGGCNSAYTKDVPQKPLPVRLEPAVIARLDAAAKRLGSNRAAVIRLCVTSFLDYFEQGGVATLPLNWKEVIAAMDGRRSVNVKMGKGGVAQTVGSGTAIFRESDDGRGVPRRRLRIGAAKRKKG